MKKICIAIFFVLISAAAVAQTGGISASDVAMRGSGDSVLLEMKLVISADAVTSLQGMEVIPTLSGGSGERAQFPAVVVNGRNRARIYARHAKFRYEEIVGSLPYKVVDLDRKFAGDTIAYSARMVAATWMGSAPMKLEFVLISPAGERMTYTVPVSVVSAAASLPEPAADPMQIITVVAEPPAGPAETGRVLTLSGTANLDFKAANATLSFDSEHNRQELDRIDGEIGQIAADPASRIVSITITGYSSPDGYYDTNASLAHDRGAAFSRWLQERYGLDAKTIKVRTAGENWNDLRAAIAGSGIPHCEDILSVVDSADAPDAKESRLRRMASGEVWSRLERDIFPGLRKVDYSIDYESAK